MSRKPGLFSYLQEEDHQTKHMKAAGKPQGLVILLSDMTMGTLTGNAWIHRALPESQCNIPQVQEPQPHDPQDGK